MSVFDVIKGVNSPPQVKKVGSPFFHTVTGYTPPPPDGGGSRALRELTPGFRNILGIKPYAQTPRVSSYGNASLHEKKNCELLWAPQIKIS